MKRAIGNLPHSCLTASERKEIIRRKTKPFESDVISKCQICGNIIDVGDIVIWGMSHNTCVKRQEFIARLAKGPTKKHKF